MGSILNRLMFRPNQAAKSVQKVSWIELFFDLVFVVAMAQVAKLLEHQVHHPDWFVLILGGGTVLTAWMQAAFYNNRFQTADGIHRLATLIQMIGVAIISTCFSAGGNDFNYDDFFVGFFLVRGALIVSYLRVGLSSTEFRAIGFGIFGYGLLTALGVFSGIHWFGDWLVYASLGLDLLLPILMRPVLARSHLKLANHHLIERFGLLVVLVFGEAIAAVVFHIHPVGYAVSKAIFIAVAMAAVAICWWLYSANADELAGERSFGLVIAWELTHILMIIGVILMSVGIHQSLRASYFGEMALYGYALCLISIGLLHFWCYLSHPERSALWMSVFRLGAAIVAIAVAWLDLGHSFFAPLVVMLLLGVIQVIADALIES